MMSIGFAQKREEVKEMLIGNPVPSTRGYKCSIVNPPKRESFVMNLVGAVGGALGICSIRSKLRRRNALKRYHAKLAARTT